MEELKRLPESELSIMLVVWNHAGPITPPLISDALKNRRPLTASALHSYLARLVEKGYLSCSKQGKSNVYTALVDEATYQSCESRTVLERLYGNSLTSFVSALYRGRGLSEQDLEELRAFIDERSGGEPDAQ